MSNEDISENFGECERITQADLEAAREEGRNELRAELAQARSELKVIHECCKQAEDAKGEAERDLAAVKESLRWALENGDFTYIDGPTFNQSIHCVGCKGVMTTETTGPKHSGVSAVTGAHRAVNECENIVHKPDCHYVMALARAEDSSAAGEGRKG